MEMLQVTKIGNKVIKSFGLSEDNHKIAVDRIINDNFGNIISDGHFLTMPDDELVQNWIDLNEENSEFLKEAVKDKATIYTLYETIIGDTAQPLGDVAVTYDYSGN
jgi:hypothetical protein